MDDKEKQKKMSKAGLIGSLLAVAFGLLYMALIGHSIIGPYQLL